jgi:hypothetical protein
VREVRGAEAVTPETTILDTAVTDDRAGGGRKLLRTCSWSRAGTRWTGVGMGAGVGGGGWGRGGRVVSFVTGCGEARSCRGGGGGGAGCGEERGWLEGGEVK